MAGDGARNTRTSALASAVAAIHRPAVRALAGRRRRAPAERAVERQTDVHDVARAVAGVLLQASVDRCADVPRQRGRQPIEPRIAVNDRGDGIGSVLAPEHAFARQHLEQHRAERPDIGAPVHGRGASLRGSCRSSGARSSARQCGAAVHPPAQQRFHLALQRSVATARLPQKVGSLIERTLARLVKELLDTVPVRPRCRRRRGMFRIARHAHRARASAVISRWSQAFANVQSTCGITGTRRWREAELR
jgi:hypothetical protein